MTTAPISESNYNSNASQSSSAASKQTGTISASNDFANILQALQTSGSDTSGIYTMLESILKAGVKTNNSEDLLDLVKKTASSSGDLEMLKALSSSTGNNGSVASLLQKYSSQNNGMMLLDALNEADESKPSNSSTSIADVLLATTGLNGNGSDTTDFLSVAQNGAMDITGCGTIENILNSLMRIPDVADKFEQRSRGNDTMS
jgi:hypothetical protein